jgi:hypothetical protein
MDPRRAHESSTPWPHARRAAASLGATLTVALLPKCPLCIAAYFTAFGIGASASGTAALFVRPAVGLLGLIALSASAVGAWRSRQRRQPPTCCGHAGSF